MFASTSRIVKLTRPLTRLASSSSTTTTTSTPFSLPGSTPASPGSSSSSSSPVILPEAYRTPIRPSQASSNQVIQPVQRNPYPYRNSSAHQVKKYKLSIFSTRNNTILTLTTKMGSSSSSTTINDPSESMITDSVVAWVSAGSAGYKGAARGTYDAAVEVSIKMFKKIEQLVDPENAVDAGMRRKNAWPRPTDLELVWNGFGKGRDAVYRTLMAGDGDGVRRLVKTVTDATPLKIGGTRPKKRRVI